LNKRRDYAWLSTFSQLRIDAYSKRAAKARSGSILLNGGGLFQVSVKAKMCFQILKWTEEVI